MTQQQHTPASQPLRGPDVPAQARAVGAQPTAGRDVSVAKATRPSPYAPVPGAYPPTPEEPDRAWKWIAGLGVVLVLAVMTLGSVRDRTTMTDPVLGPPSERAARQNALGGAGALTPVELKALAVAADYLRFSAFSHAGLVQQLVVVESFPKSAAVFAADHVPVDWNVQAAKAAKSYLSFGPFTRDDLVEQLVLDGFTRAEASHGARQNGL